MLVLYVDIKPSIVYTKEEPRTFLIQQRGISSQQWNAIQNCEKWRENEILKKEKEQQWNTNRALYVTQPFNKYLLNIVPGIEHTHGHPCLDGTYSLVEETDNKWVNRIINSD